MSKGRWVMRWQDRSYPQPGTQPGSASVFRPSVFRPFPYRLASIHPHGQAALSLLILTSYLACGSCFPGYGPRDAATPPIDQPTTRNSRQQTAKHPKVHTNTRTRAPKGAQEHTGAHRSAQQRTETHSSPHRGSNGGPELKRIHSSISTQSLKTDRSTNQRPRVDTQD